MSRTFGRTCQLWITIGGVVTGVGHDADMSRNNKQRRATKKRKRQAAGTARPHRHRLPHDASPTDGGPPHNSPPHEPGDDPWADHHGPSADHVYLGAQVWNAARMGPGPLRQAIIHELQGYGQPGIDAAQNQLATHLKSAWGKQLSPVELLHLINHRRAKAHVGVMAAVVLRHPPTSDDHPPAWSAQIQQIDAQHRTAPAELTIELAVEVLQVLLTLPVMPPNVTVPRNDPAHQLLESTILTRVQALLRKAESTSFDAEAEALTAKAQQLITRHAIDAARLAAPQQSGATPNARRILLHNPYISAKSLLVDAVARANRCRAVYHPDAGWSTVFGFEVDLDATELLTASLLAQAVNAMARLGSQRDVYGRSRTRSFRHAFLQGFAVRIGQRLDQANRDVLNTTTDQEQVLPVLASRELKVRDAMAAAFPKTVRQVSSLTNGEGWVAGKIAADLASLNVASTALPHAS